MATLATGLTQLFLPPAVITLYRRFRPVSCFLFFSFNVTSQSDVAHVGVRAQILFDKCCWLCTDRGRWTDLGACLPARDRCANLRLAGPHCVWALLTKQTPNGLKKLGELDGAPAAFLLDTPAKGNATRVTTGSGSGDHRHLELDTGIKPRVSLLRAQTMGSVPCSLQGQKCLPQISGQLVERPLIPPTKPFLSSDLLMNRATNFINGNPSLMSLRVISKASGGFG